MSESSAFWNASPPSLATNAVDVTMTLSLTNAPIGSAAVKLYKRPNASAPWAFFADATTNASLESVMRHVPLDRKRASILLTHAPDHPATAEALGFSLQLSGHTHLGQFVPWSWMARRMYRQFVYGLSRIGKMQVFTSSGAGTWGPPLRLGSNPEIVMLEFE